MTPGEIEEFGRMFSRLMFAGLAAPDIKSPEDLALTIEVYFETLQGFSLEEVRAAIPVVIRQSERFIPSAGVLYAACCEIRSTQRKSLEQARKDQLALKAAELPEEVAAAKRQCQELIEKI